MNLVAACSIVENVTKVTGIALNILLLYLTIVFSRKGLGTYKYLLIVFASSDVVLTLVHTVIHHQIVSVGTMFCSVAYAFGVESRYITATYCSSFTLVFSLTIFNFLYRFWAVKYPNLVQLYSKPYFIAILASIAASTFFSWYGLCMFGMTGGIDDVGTKEGRELYYRRYGRTLMDGFQILDHWRDGRPFSAGWSHAAAVMVTCNALIVFCISFATVLAFLCFYHIRKPEKLSVQSRRLQAKLLVTLCAQTAVPIVCVFIPYFTVLSLPFVAIDSTILDTSCTALISLFPTCDAIVIIALMTDYREGLKSMIVRTKTAVTKVQPAPSVSSKFVDSTAVSNITDVPN